MLIGARICGQKRDAEVQEEQEQRRKDREAPAEGPRVAPRPVADVAPVCRGRRESLCCLSFVLYYDSLISFVRLERHES